MRFHKTLFLVSTIGAVSSLIEASLDELKASPPNPTPTMRELKNRIAEGARQVSDITNAEFSAGRRSGFQVYVWSCRRLAADEAIGPGSVRVDSRRRHVDLMRAVDRDIKSRVERRQVGAESYVAGDFYRYDAEASVQPEQTGASTVDATYRLAAARLVYVIWRDDSDLHHKELRAPGILFWSRKVLEVELASARDRASRVTALEAFLGRTKEIEKFADDLHLAPPPSYIYELRRESAGAALLLMEEKGKASGRELSEARKEWHRCAEDAYEADWSWSNQNKNTLYLDRLYEQSCWPAPRKVVQLL